jgi:hypothetical protein
LRRSERAEHFRAEQRAEWVLAEEGREQVADRWQVREPAGGGAGTPLAVRPVSIACGTRLLRPMSDWVASDSTNQPLR